MKTVSQLMGELEVGGQTTINARQVIELVLESSREGNEKNEKRAERIYSWMRKDMLETLAKMFEEYLGEATHGGDDMVEKYTKEERMQDFIGYAWFSKYQEMHEADMKAWEEKKKLKTGEMATCRIPTDITLEIGDK